MKRKERNEAIRNLRLTDQFWKNVPIIDATEMLCIFPQKADLENAQPGDPENCVYAKCIKRVWPHARRVRIWSGVALVETENKKGETIAQRYIISAKGKRALRNFDKGIGEIKPCSLLPPTQSTKLENQRIRTRQRYAQSKVQKVLRAKQRLRELQAGIYNPVSTTKHKADLTIRNGSGHSRV